MAEPAANATSQPFGLRRLRALLALAGRPVVLVAFLLVATLSGLLEAGVILVVIAIAAALADGGGSVSLEMGALDLHLSEGEAVLVGAGMTALLLLSAIPNAWLGARMSTRVLTRVRARLFRSLVGASWDTQSAVSEAHFHDLIAVHAFRIANLVLILTVFATNVVGLLALVAAAVLLDPLTAAVLLAIVGGLGVVFRPLIQSIRRGSERHVAEHHLYVGELENVIGVLPEIRVFGVRDAAGDLLERVSGRTSSEYRQMMFRGRLVPGLYLGATAGLLLVGLAVAGSQDNLDPTRVGAIVVFLLRALRYSQQVQAGWQAVMQEVPYLDRVDDALDSWDRSGSTSGSRTLARAGVLELRDASYAYPTGQVGVSHVDVTVNPGEIVGLEGPSGAGKSTLVQLILGLRRPTSGAYLVDGQPVEDFDEASWFARFAYVAQDPRLIEGDVRDNVRFLRPEVSDADVDRALAEAGFERDLAGWESGTARQVGARGRELSGGQRQRIAIARALAGSPDVLIMDEPTSSLDRASEEIVRTTLESLRGRITVILIAHRESTLTVCDRILRVDQHTVRERTDLPSS